MVKYIVALLCGTSITGSVYMAGWGSKTSSLTDNDACCGASESPHAVVMAAAPTDGKIDVGNKKCIVMGDDIGTGTVEYQGKIYHICCSDCVETFNKDPQKYVKALEADPAKYGVAKK